MNHNVIPLRVIFKPVFNYAVIQNLDSETIFLLRRKTLNEEDKNSQQESYHGMLMKTLHVTEIFFLLNIKYHDV